MEDAYGFMWREPCRQRDCGDGNVVFISMSYGGSPVARGIVKVGVAVVTGSSCNGAPRRHRDS